MSIFYVGIADSNWFSVLKKDYNNGALSKSINFWTPGTRIFRAIEPGDLFLFKLHNKKSTGESGEIVGGGYFSYYDKMSISEAWDRYGRGNGCESLGDMQKSLNAIQEKINVKSNVEIGCIILENIFFLDSWIQEPADWNKSIVSGKKYSTDTEIGLDLYNLVNERIKSKQKGYADIIEEIETKVKNLSLEGKEKKDVKVSVATPVIPYPEPKPPVVIPADIVGKQVKHKTFGTGEITAIAGASIVVNFDKVGEKKMGYAFCIKNNMLDFI